MSMADAAAEMFLQRDWLFQGRDERVLISAIGFLLPAHIIPTSFLFS